MLASVKAYKKKKRSHTLSSTEKILLQDCIDLQNIYWIVSDMFY
jgi:hypothetical protein